MSITTLFGSKADGWTEKLVAAFYLHGIEPPFTLFESHTAAHIRELWALVRGLPDAWATEICGDTLKGEHVEK